MLFPIKCSTLNLDLFRLFFFFFNSNQVYGAGVALTGLATIPNWPWLNRNPLTWLPVEEKEEEEKKEAEGDDEGDADEASPSKGKTSSSPSLKTTTKRAATQRRQPAVE